MSNKSAKFLGREIATCGVGCNVPGIIAIAEMKIAMVEEENQRLSKKLAKLAKENEEFMTKKMRNSDQE